MKFIKYITAFLAVLILPFGLFGQSSEEIKIDKIEIETLIETAVYFDFGKYDLRIASDSTLSALIEEIKDKKNIQIEVTAHTDAIGTNDANDILSQNRADQVKDFLVKYGVSDSLITASVYGENVPVADNITEQGRQQNRRATIKVLREIPPIPKMNYSGVVRDEVTGEGIAAEIIFHSKTMRDSFKTNERGEFFTSIPEGEIVGFDVYAPCYFFENKMFKAKKVGQLEFVLQKMEKGAAFPIKNLYFVGNKADLLTKSAPTLPKVLAFMERNDCGRIEIAGHINRPNAPPVIESSWDFQLSIRRAKMVYDYLISNGISPSRLTYQGYGNTQMVYPRARAEKQQALNRRVELRVLEEVDFEVEK